MISFKKIYLIQILLLFLTFQQAQAQEEVEITTRTEQTNRKKKNKFHYSNINQYQQTLLFKLNLLQTTYFEGDLQLSYLVEKKILPFLSIDARGSQTASTYLLDIHEYIDMGARYYPTKRKNSRAAGNRINNFTGTYVRAGVLRLFGKKTSRDPQVFNNFNLAYGYQEKVGKWGYYDLSAVVSYQNSSYIPEATGWVFRVSVEGGLGYGPNKAPQDYLGSSTYTTALREWSGTLFAIRSPTINLNQRESSLGAGFTGETYLQNYFTLHYALNTALGRLQYEEYYFNRDPTLELDGAVMFRRYLGIQKKMRKGITLPGFSGPYLTAGVGSLVQPYLKGITDGNNYYVDYVVKRDFKMIPEIGLGWQKVINRRIIFDIGYRFRTRTRFLNYNYRPFRSTLAIRLN